ncbi:MAG: transcription termination factor Rho [Clostridiales bacterium]|nr:transcription termination factor Rho [Clostridiales bacterium]
MTENELKAMTVVQLKQLARELKVTLGAGIDKAGIVKKLLAAHEASLSPEEAEAERLAEEVSADMGQPAEPKFQAAWHNSDSPVHAARPAHPQPATYGGRPAWQTTSPSGRHLTAEQQHIQPRRPGAAVPRFGPASVHSPAPAAEEPAAPAAPSFSPASSYGPVSPLPEKRFSRSGDSGFGPRSSGPVVMSSYSAGPAPSRSYEPFSPIQPQETGITAPSLEDLLASGEYEEGSGVLELHPDGYGFLRAASFLPSSRDVYVSMAQIRRFGLRTGDLVEGKIRPQREGDKYAALLYITTVNGVPEESAFTRPVFDEMTPVYPTKRISLEAADGHSQVDMRLVDLIAPLGFGQRALILAPPETGKTDIMCGFARIICQNYPDVQVLMLLIDVTPEDATMIRDSVPCQVLSSTFDQAPEAHLRLSEIVLERAMRLVEQKKDVVLLVDSLTRLAKIYTTAAAQQGRSLPGMVNPASLFRAKRLFGAARSCKEGGSLTVIAAMDIQTGSKVDDSVVEEFKGTANMELTLDQAVARAGVRPAINLQHSFTKNADILLSESQKEGLSMVRAMLSTATSAVAIPQLISMMDKAETNADLLIKIKDWMALMNR